MNVGVYTLEECTWWMMHTCIYTIEKKQLTHVSVTPQKMDVYNIGFCYLETLGNSSSVYELPLAYNQEWQSAII